MAKLKFEIVTAERTVYSAEVDIVVAPGALGEFAILPSHAALVSTLQPGEILVRKGNEEESIFVSGGFLEVRDNRVEVLADTAERAEEIDTARAEAAKQRAQERITSHVADVDLQRASFALQRSLMRLRVAEKRRKKRPQ